MSILSDKTSSSIISNSTVASPIFRKFNCIKNSGHSVYHDSCYFTRVLNLFTQHFDNSENFFQNDNLLFYKKFCSCKDRKMSEIYGSASGEKPLKIYCTPAVAVKYARPYLRQGKIFMMITSSFNGINTDKAHARLVLIRYTNEFEMVIYDPMKPSLASPGSIEKILAQSLRIRTAGIACGTQRNDSMQCVRNCLAKALELLTSPLEFEKIDIVKKYDFVLKKLI